MWRWSCCDCLILKNNIQFTAEIDEQRWIVCQKQHMFCMLNDPPYLEEQTLLIFLISVIKMLNFDLNSQCSACYWLCTVLMAHKQSGYTSSIPCNARYWSSLARIFMGQAVSLKYHWMIWKTYAYILCSCNYSCDEIRQILRYTSEPECFMDFVTRLLQERCPIGHDLG